MSTYLTLRGRERGFPFAFSLSMGEKFLLEESTLSEGLKFYTKNLTGIVRLRGLG